MAADGFCTAGIGTQKKCDCYQFLGVPNATSIPMLPSRPDGTHRKRSLLFSIFQPHIPYSHQNADQKTHMDSTASLKSTDACVHHCQHRLGSLFATLIIRPIKLPGTQDNQIHAYDLKQLGSIFHGRDQENPKDQQFRKKSLSSMKQCFNMLRKGVVFPTLRRNSNPRHFINMSRLCSEEQVQGEIAECPQQSTDDLTFSTVQSSGLRQQTRRPQKLVWSTCCHLCTKKEVVLCGVTF